MNKLRALMISMVTLFAIFSASAQVPEAVITDIVDSYVPWTSAEFSGRMRSEKLPLSPTIKIYMVRDSLLQISLRAPLVGEVGRVELSKDELLMVNKMRRVYCREDAAGLMELWPSVLSDFQSLLLARIAILGNGELSADNCAELTVESDGRGNWTVSPRVDGAPVKFDYSYIVGPNARTQAFLASMASQGSLTIKYAYRNRAMQMNCCLDRKGKQTVVDLDFDSVKWGGKLMTPLRLTDYARVGIREFLASLQ